MSKIEFNTEEQEVSITRKIGKGGESTVTISPEVAGLQINLGIISLGATTDFCGAISLGIAGQEITWGREGGTIHIGIGGFAVDVEARDCIVTETKSIFGIIVAQRSYRDPGCKQEKKEEEKPPDFPDTPENGIQMPDGSANVFVVLKGIRKSVYRTGDPPGSWYTDTSNSEHDPSVSGVPENVAFSNEIAPFTVSETYVATKIQQAAQGRTVEGAKVRTLKTSASGQSKNIRLTYSSFYLVFYSGISYTFQTESTIDGAPSDPWSSIFTMPVQIVYGSQTDCNRFVKSLSRAPRNTAKESLIEQYIIIRVIKLGKQAEPLPKPFLPTGNKPPMKNCCEEVLDMLEDIKEAFAVDRILKDKFPVSNTFMAPECDPASVTRAKNYYEVFQCVMRMMAHGMIFEPRVNIKDADAAKAGDQEFKAKYLNATGWASAVSEALLEVKDDGNISTNMDIRNGFAATQTMVGLADAIYRIDAILDCMGIELVPKVETVETPYNVQIQIGKGFGEGNERQIDLNTDEATEKLLPSFLQVKKNKIKTVDVHPRSRSLREILESIESNLPGGNNG